ncbi:Vacuolar amino acid transporter [Salix suchowensis]|nr:Vacuolar amino acid transporter [Salix suchowensis]
MRKIEDQFGIFDAWIRSVDKYGGDDLLYLNHWGIIPPESVVAKGRRRENPFKEHKRFDATAFPSDVKDIAFIKEDEASGGKRVSMRLSSSFQTQKSRVLLYTLDIYVDRHIELGDLREDSPHGVSGASLSRFSSRYLTSEISKQPALLNSERTLASFWSLGPTKSRSDPRGGESSGTDADDEFEMVQTYGVVADGNTQEPAEYVHGTGHGESESSALLGESATGTKPAPHEGHATIGSCVSNLANTIIGSGMSEIDIVLCSLLNLFGYRNAHISYGTCDGILAVVLYKWQTLAGHGVGGILPGIITCLFSGSVAVFGLYLLSLCATKTPHRRASFFAVAQLTFPKAAVFFDAAIAIKCFGVSIRCAMLEPPLLCTL